MSLSTFMVWGLYFMYFETPATWILS